MIKADYDKRGILFPIRIFSTDDISFYRKEFDNVNGNIQLDKKNGKSTDRHFDLEFVWNLATYPGLISFMQELIGPDLLLLATDFFVKQGDPTSESFVAWHQDSTYWGLQPPEAHTAWIALDDSTEENGSMRVIPGSHHNGLVMHGNSSRKGNLLSINQEIPDELVETEKAEHVNLKAGEISIHDGRVFHSSMPNRSTNRRAGLTVRFITPNVKQTKNNSLGGFYKPILVAGRDRLQNFPKVDKPFPIQN